MTYQETTHTIRSAVGTIFAEVDTWFDQPEAVRSYQPATGNWSINQVLEHVSLTNHYLMLTLRKWVKTAEKRAAKGILLPQGESELEKVDVIGERGSFPWVRPEHMEPTGELSSAQVRATLRHQRDECLAILDQIRGGVGALCRINMSVNDLGKLDLYQWVYFLAQHARRHVQQMEAIAEEFRDHE